MPESTSYRAERLTYDSDHGFALTRARFDDRVPLLDPGVALELVLDQSPWTHVEHSVLSRLGPTGLMALARLDQGALMSLSGQPLDATLYLVGNPLIAHKVMDLAAAGSLYAPFRVAIFRDPQGVHVAYDQPSTVFASLESAGVEQIGLELDRTIADTVEEVCKA